MESLVSKDIFAWNTVVVVANTDCCVKLKHCTLQNSGGKTSVMHSFIILWFKLFLKNDHCFFFQ